MQWISTTTDEGAGPHLAPAAVPGVAVGVDPQAKGRRDLSSNGAGYRNQTAEAGAETKVARDRDRETTGGGMAGAHLAVGGGATALIKPGPAPGLTRRGAVMTTITLVRVALTLLRQRLVHLPTATPVC